MSIFNKRKRVSNPYNNYKGGHIKESWFHHCRFGLKISSRLLITSFVLLSNSLLPFIPIPQMFRIHDTSHWLGTESFKRKQDRMKYMRGL